MLNITAQNFPQEVTNSKLPIIVDFWADWCMPCKMLAPVFEKVSKDFAGKMHFAKLNVDQSPQLAEQHDVRGIPCMIIFKNGKEADRLVGAMNEGILREKIGATLR
jgi:thioredoxin 1